MKLKLFKPKPIFKLNDVFQIDHKSDGYYKGLCYIEKIKYREEGSGYFFKLKWMDNDPHTENDWRNAEELCSKGFRYIGNFETNLKALGLLYGQKR